MTNYNNYSDEEGLFYDSMPGALLEKRGDIDFWLKETETSLSANSEDLASRLSWVHCHLIKSELPLIALSSPLEEMFTALSEQAQLALPGSNLFFRTAKKLGDRGQHKLAISMFSRAEELLDIADKENSDGQFLTSRAKQRLDVNTGLLESLEKELVSAEKRRESKTYLASLEEESSERKKLQGKLEKAIAKLPKDNSIGKSPVEAATTASSQTQDQTPESSQHHSESLSQHSIPRIDPLANEQQKPVSDLDLSFGSQSSAPVFDDSSETFKEEGLAGEISSTRIREERAPDKSSGDGLWAYMPIVLFLISGGGLAVAYHTYQQGNEPVALVEPEVVPRAVPAEIGKTTASSLPSTLPVVSELKEVKPETLTTKIKDPRDGVPAVAASESKERFDELSRRVDQMNKVPDPKPQKVPVKRPRVEEVKREVKPPVAVIKPAPVVEEPVLEADLPVSPRLPESVKTENLPIDSRVNIYKGRDGRSYGPPPSGGIRPSDGSRGAPRGYPVRDYSNPVEYEVIVRTDVYLAPSLRSKAVVRLERGAKVSVVSKMGNWLELRSAEGSRGYIYAQDAIRR